MSTTSFYQEVYGPVAWHVSEQSYASERSFEKSDIDKNATRLKLCSEQLQLQQGQMKICPF